MKRTLALPGAVTIISALIGSSLLGLVGGLLHGGAPGRGLAGSGLGRRHRARRTRDAIGLGPPFVHRLHQPAQGVGVHRAPALGVQGLWWNAPAESESGWGVTQKLPC